VVLASTPLTHCWTYTCGWYARRFIRTSFWHLDLRRHTISQNTEDEGRADSADFITSINAPSVSAFARHRVRDHSCSDVRTHRARTQVRHPGINRSYVSLSSPLGGGLSIVQLQHLIIPANRDALYIASFLGRVNQPVRQGRLWYLISLVYVTILFIPWVTICRWPTSLSVSFLRQSIHHGRLLRAYL